MEQPYFLTYSPQSNIFEWVSTDEEKLLSDQDKFNILGENDLVEKRFDFMRPPPDPFKHKTSPLRANDTM